MDPELDAMSKVADAIGGLERDAQARVVRWAAERFGASVGSPEASRRGGSPNRSTRGSHAGSDSNDETATFKDFAELFDQYRPTAEDERTLVAAYWIQVLGERESWSSLDLNRELKNLGHEVGHIARVLQRSIDAKPSLVLQLRRNGRTPQSRKTYKLSGAGIKAVEARLSGPSGEE